MYEQFSHAVLNEILDGLDLDGELHELRPFLTRLGANFYGIHALFDTLYGEHPGAEDCRVRLVDTMARAYLARAPELRGLDLVRERDPDWFLSQTWVAMALYTDGFAGDLAGMPERLPYLQDLGVDIVHLMPMLQCPPGASDGGYAVSDFRAIDERFGTLDDLHEVAAELRKRDMLLVLDVVLNHTSREHEWARAAREGSERHRAFYFTYPNREIPDAYEETMPEVFPEVAPGNFTWDDELDRWVMTVFHGYQWDLDYSNPEVFVEMLDIVLTWANHGADILRLDAVAFLWKKIGTRCQNEREAHLILQLMKDCCQVSAPGVLFIAEAIVAPVEVIRYFGEDAVVAKECEIAYNATLMALLWDGVATRNARLLRAGLTNLPDKLPGATWLNYVRCHDDIGLGFSDADAHAAGYDPTAHRSFLINYFTGVFEGTPARGEPFGRNDKTGDARISGSLASLAGLESALESEDPERIDDAIRTIVLLHSIILSFGGIPLLYYGDEIGTLNDVSYLQDIGKANDSRWLHRPTIDWAKAERRHERDTIEARIFQQLKHLIAIRKRTPAFADDNDRTLVDVDNEHLFVYLRVPNQRAHAPVCVVANFDTDPQPLDHGALARAGVHERRELTDLVTGESLSVEGNHLWLPGRSFAWLVDRARR